MLLLKIPLHVSRVRPSCHNIQIEPVRILVVQDHLHHIIRMAGRRVGGKPGNHTAHHGTGDDAVGRLHSKGVGDKLMMETLENCIHIILLLILNQAHPVKRIKPAGIKLIKRKPIIHQRAKALKQRGSVLYIKINGFSALPSPVFQNQIHRNIVVENRDKHLDPVPAAFFKQVPVKPDPLLIGHLIIPIWIDSCPVNRGSQHLNAKLMKQPDILPVSVIKVNPPPERIVNRILVCKSPLKFCVVHTTVLKQSPLFLCPRRVKIS